AHIAVELINKSFIANDLGKIDYKALILIIILFIPFSFFEKKPFFVILAGALGGILIHLF
ncbi:hypothetical protein II906_11415, partial [bacterium]|nr:hypothetical protein [bacterium]